MESLLILAIVIIVFWLGAIAYYFYISRQQVELFNEIDELRDVVEVTEEDIN